MSFISNEGFLLSFKQPDINKLRADCYGVILAHHAKGHVDIKAQFRVCFWRKQYLMVSRIIITGVDTETNKAIKIFKGTNAIKKYITAKWKFDHARSKEIEWNYVTFECDGESVRMNTSYNEDVTKAAEQDVHSGIIDRGIKGFLSTLHELTIGRYHSSDQ